MHESHSTPELPSAFLQHAEFLRRLARTLLRDEHAAEDLVQETFVRALQNPPRHGGGLRAWLGAIARNLAFNEHRSRRRRNWRESEAARAEAEPSTAEHAEQQAAMRRVVDALLELDEPYRDVLWMRFFRELSVRAIAAELGVAEPTVRSRIARGLAKLRQRLLSSEDPGHLSALVALAGPPGSLVSRASLGPWAAFVAASLVAVAGFAWFAAGSKSESSSDPGSERVSRNADTTRSETSLAAAVVTAQPAREAAAETTTTDSMLSGRVRNLAYEPLDMEAGPAVGVEVRIGYQHAGSWRNVTLTTDEGGEFSLEPEGLEGWSAGQDLPAQLQVSVPAHAQYRGANVRVTLGENYGDAELERVAHGLVQGTVVDRQGQPLPAAEVVIGPHLKNIASTTRTDEQGAFHIPAVSDVRHIEARLPGRRQLSLDARLEQLPQGGYAPVRIVLAPAGRIELEVVDRTGQPVEEVPVMVFPAESERWQQGSNLYSVPRGETDGSGGIQLDGVWADTELELYIGLGFMATVFRARQGEELMRQRAGALPIVLSTGEHLQVRATLSGPFGIDSIVRDEKGNPVADAKWRISDISRSRFSAIASGSTDEDGRLRVTLAREIDIQGPLRIEVVAGEHPPEPAEKPAAEPTMLGLGYMGTPVEPGDGRRRSKGVVDLPLPAPGEVASPELILVPTATLEVRVMDAEREPLEFDRNSFDSWVVNDEENWRVRLEGGPSDREALAVQPEGGLRARDLVPAVYRLCVEKRSPGPVRYTTARHTFLDLRPGSGLQTLELPQLPRARVTLVAGGAAARPTRLLIGRLDPLGSAPEAAQPPHAPEEQRVQALHHWPTYALPPFESMQWHEEAGAYDLTMFPAQELTSELPPLSTGWYRFGLLSSDADGLPCTPIATDWAYYGEGEFRIEFEPRQTGHLVGRLRDDGPARFWSVALVDEHDALVPVVLDVSHSDLRIVDLAAWDLGAARTFDFDRAPCGSFRLRAGTRQQLTRGEFEREVPVEIHVGKVTRVDL